MKVWMLTENDDQIRFYWFATRHEAAAHARQYAKDKPGYHATIKPYEVTGTRHGIVVAMNHALRLTCFNEG